MYNLQGEHLGSVYNLMVDKISGQVAYAVMSFGGFLGMGESYHIFSKLDGRMPRAVQDAVSIAHQNLHEGRLIAALTGAIQPVFD